MGKKLCKEAIRIRTEEYWQYLRNGTCDLDCYIEELLGRELAYAAEHDTEDGAKRLRRLNQPIHTLALTVGESFEPLLQLICVLQPRRVILILNRRYGGTVGRNHGATFRRLAQKLQDIPDLPAEYRPEMTTVQFDLIELRQDTPTEVFQKLRDALQKSEALAPETYINCVDITGAKKSMVVGAFLYAAHSGLPITYVDFDEFSKEYGKPYGYTCKIGQIADPYTLFRLRDWEQVRKLYEHYNFRGARELIEGTEQEPENSILHAMESSMDDKKEPAIFESADVDKVRQIVKLLQVYEAWDSGNFREATNLPSAIPGSELPTIIPKLGHEWFLVSAAAITGGPSDFYENQENLVVYCFDELNRIKRVIVHSQDYRSAYLRAGSLNEIIMIARLIKLVTDFNSRSELLRAMRERTPIAKDLFNELANTKAGELLSLRDIGLKNAPIAAVSISTEMTKWWKKTTHFSNDDGWEQFIELRNKLTHRYMSVPLSLAEDALKFVQVNFEDFSGQKLEQVELLATAVSWNRLCALHKLDFLPPRLRD